MSTIDLAIQRVAGLDEQLASKLLAWLDSQQVAKAATSQERPLGARALIGFAVQGGHEPRSTSDWMKELREGDED
jgi:hypothetical protein